MPLRRASFRILLPLSPCTCILRRVFAVQVVTLAFLLALARRLVLNLLRLQNELLVSNQLLNEHLLVEAVDVEIL